ncbi:hypothetical protein, conserved [Eimeria maxima]|uniref:Uncharacterized protein n=1 Tax=Eimeria maxima TaxID=5804 RepID=U6MD26_EIMMA|nr:hypothetical protein, conserved [Eimeria maxima]CDJ59540.1 hypothetical protein, conserved [Eimeria maxima]
MRRYRARQPLSPSKYVLFALSPVSNYRRSPHTAERNESDDLGRLLPEINAEVPVVGYTQSPINLSPTAPRVSAPVHSNSPASNAYAPSASHKLKSAPAESSDPLRERRWTPQPTALDKYLAGLRHHLSMEERLSICMAVAKNLHDSVAARDGGRLLVQSENCPLPSLPPIHEEIAANSSRTTHVGKRPRCPTSPKGERPEQRRKPLFRIKLPVSGDPSQLAAPTTIGGHGSPGQLEIADSVDAAVLQ